MISRTHEVTHRTLRNWMREHLEFLRDASAAPRPPGRPRGPETERAAAEKAVRAVFERLGVRAGEDKIFHELRGEVPLRLVREYLAELKVEHKRRERRARESARTHTVVHARGAIWSLDGTHLGNDEEGAKVIGEVVREVASTRTLAGSIGPPASSAEVAALLERTVQETGECPLVLASDNGPENRGEAQAWCERRNVVRLWNLPHTPQHNPWVEHGNAELKAETGLGKGVLVTSLRAVARAIEGALTRIDGLLPRPTRGWRTARQAYAELPCAERLVDRDRFAAEAHCAIAAAVQDCRTARQRRLAERRAVLATLERHELITQHRGRTPSRASEAEDVL